MTAVTTPRGRLAWALAGLLCHTTVASAQLDEYGVKSAFVYNFLQFTDWPESRLGPNEALVVCILTDSPITPRLNALETRQVKGHRIEVRTIASASDAPRCHVVFVPDGTNARGLALPAADRNTGLLIIGEDRAADAGDAVINLVVVDQRVAFDISLDVAAGQGLRLSSKLIRLARHIHGGEATPHGGSR